MSDLSTIFNILLAFFTIASCILMFVTLTNAYRLRNILLSWDSGKLFGFPLFASVFMLFTLGMLAGVTIMGLSGYTVVLTFYVLMSFNWLMSSYFMSRRYITDHGIVKNINDPSQTIPWSNVHDLVEIEHDSGINFAFFYLPYNGPGDSRHCIRVELSVPNVHLDSFRKIMDHKLGRRFSKSQVPVPGFKQIN
ncbi:MAG: hypothetical protein EA364_05820 [Balneolaceae bacterium]|jgi:hypothetical protein|nr:MAG: hypothetical protein EA364_05820 [Balneolaceae bacterium]